MGYESERGARALLRCPSTALQKGAAMASLPQWLHRQKILCNSRIVRERWFALVPGTGLRRPSSPVGCEWHIVSTSSPWEDR